MMRRHADPTELARTSGMVAAWKRRVAEKAEGNDLADEHWYAYLLTIARPVPKPACDACDDTGVMIVECSIHMRCLGWVCQRDDKRSDRDWTHSYARPCTCAAGRPWEQVFNTAVTSKPEPAAKKGGSTSYGFRKAF